MKLMINILFLAITVFFSFGYTSYQSACNHNVSKIEKEDDSHGCCHNTQTTCCDDKAGCNDNCCLEPKSILELDEFVAFKSNKQIQVVIFESIKQFIYLFKTDTYYFKSDELKSFAYLHSKPIGKQILSKKQCWLI